MKHTQGKWETSVCKDTTGQINWDVCVECGGDMIADLSHCGVHNTEANAKLIAAAPELLEALQLSVDEFNESHGASGDVWIANKNITELIRKAKGE